MSTVLHILVIVIVLFVLYLFLVAPRMFGKPDRTPLYGVLYAHRGLFDNQAEAPENSLPAFRKAVDAGYGIELDVQLSKDGIPVVFHDASLKRMCGIDGNVWEYDLEELLQMKLAGSDATIPTFQEVLATVDGKVPLIIEYKLDVAQTKVCELVNEMLSHYKGVYCIECFHPLALLWYRKHRPDIVRGQLCMEYWKEEKYRGNPLFLLLSYLVTNIATRPDFIAYQHSDASNLSRRVARRLGALSVAWTIKSQEQLEEARKHFDLFIFDSFIPKN
ncbi:MAG: glycerophosphodiester phosphodiesterase family protein [Clostridiales bacterium]|nr:glycerophosphodiester phosphodiesterase [Roseburia sp.]MDD7638109.1 glycerophosphodiester phosphodiesterase family protein [Clostridiales bacterium]MDY4111503.1 glycerophosphodiester phosphodiesterase family protein [Roseburia sp.]